MLIESTTVIKTCSRLWRWPLCDLISISTRSILWSRIIEHCRHPKLSEIAGSLSVLVLLFWEKSRRFSSEISCLCSANVLKDSVHQQCKYLKNPKAKLEELRKKIKELNALMEDVNTKLNLARREHGKEPKAQVRVWLENVQKFDTHQVLDLVEKSRQEKRCLYGCFPNYYSRLKLGEFIDNKINDVIELLQKGQFLDDSLAEFSLEMGNTLPTTKMVSNLTTERTLKEIWNYILADKVGRIGVYGKGGVGKTTIMKEIYNRLIEAKKNGKRFGNVVWVTVSKELDIHKLQEDIAQGIGLELSKEHDIVRRAGKVFDSLRERKRFVLILDDLWKQFSLEDIGIPIPTKDNGCKLIFTTRSLHVCRHMETEKQVEVKALSDKESWDIFVEKVGSSVLVDQKIQKLAKEVAKECGGLPLALVTIGRALRNVNQEKDWQNALASLKGSGTNVEGMENKVFSQLRFSYDALKDHTTRLCFLYSALYPEAHQIKAKELIEYWMWDGPLGNVGRIKAQIWKGEMILKDLIDLCLIENASENGGIEYVKMHDLIRDMAIDIMKTRPCCMIQAGVGLDYPPLEEEWVEDVERISLMYNNLKFLQGNPKCPNLSSLLLQHNSISENISHSFFSHMYNLKVLDLSFTDISFLPNSISDLRNLRALLLSWCQKLTILPSLVKLQALRVLDLSYTIVKELPEGMEMLNNLRRLNVSHAHQLRVFPARLLTKLTLLEELLMHCCWDLYGLVFVEELINSRPIVVLEVGFDNTEVFDNYVKFGHWNNLQSFKFCVSGSYKSYLGKKDVEIYGNFLLDGAPILLPETTTGLQLWECHDINRLSMCISSAMELGICRVRSCFKMECVIFNGENNLNNLEILELSNLINLRTICNGVLVPGIFSRLKIMDVNNCESLTSLLTPELCQCLENLEQLFVGECPQMNVIIEDEAMAQNCEGSLNIAPTIYFPKLRRLKLNNLVELKGFYSGEIVCDSIRTINIKQCEGLKRLLIKFLVKYEQITPQVLTIEGEKEWWDSLELDNPQAKTILQQTAEFNWSS
ncbi:hypothetical protein F0562_023913 [Nyssa sinensis]|uniref:AAA+ ATPase domain-containing protein n=1 Tax=Nyssa sinensis TaxID=561372 RepID=A0A5J5BNM0_9ASTE|nr:hypothetical protein F0562_023913 [Nyssa sinensis]